MELERVHYIAGLVLFLILVAGTIALAGVDLISGESSGTHSSSDIEGIYITSHELNRSSQGSFSMELEFQVTLGPVAGSSTPIEDIHACVYNESGDVVFARNMGSIDSTGATRNVTIETDVAPKYTFVHHPRFRGIEGEHQVLGYEDEHDQWRSLGTNNLPFDYDEMNWTGCQPP